MQRVGQIFNLHRLELGDIVQPHQRAKVEEYSDHVYIVLRAGAGERRDHPGVPVRTTTSPGRGRTMAQHHPDPRRRLPPAASSAHPHLEAGASPRPAGSGTRPGESVATILDSDQISMSLGHGWLITFQEKPGDCFEPVRGASATPRASSPRSAADTLAYALLDAVIDSYFPILENAGGCWRISRTGARGPTSAWHAIHEVKRDLLTIRRAIWPARGDQHASAPRAT